MEKKFVVCIDSDGCIMDTMNYKHIYSFGPLAAEIFNIEKKEEFLKMWNDINLFTKTRGVNRFKGLSIAMKKIKEIDNKVEDFIDLNTWLDNTAVLSNASLINEIKRTDSDELKKVLLWSEKVNEKIKELEHLSKPFEGAKEALEEISKKARVVIVSSANKEAILSEWEKFGLLEYVDEVMGQDKGLKQDCIKYVINQGYSKENIVMIGDSLGDLDAAKINEVYFYPIIFDDEKNSWNNFKDNILELFLNHKYDDRDIIEKYNEKLNK